MAGIPLVANGVGRVCFDLLSGVMATYISVAILLIVAMVIGIVTSIVGYLFIDQMPVFLVAWTLRRVCSCVVRAEPESMRLRPSR